MRRGVRSFHPAASELEHAACLHKQAMTESTTKSKGWCSTRSNLQCYGLRLGPGEEIRSNLLEFVKVHGLQAAFILSCVGSVQRAKLRLANATATNTNEVIDLDGRHEIVSLVGTLSEGGHLHASLSDIKGGVVGGHVIGDMVVFTTAEIVIGECCQLQFTREMDDKTGFKELSVHPKPKI